jgi:hypothetical protein
MEAAYLPGDDANDLRSIKMCLPLIRLAGPGAWLYVRQGAAWAGWFPDPGRFFAGQDLGLMAAR